MIRLLIGGGACQLGIVRYECLKAPVRVVTPDLQGWWDEGTSLQLETHKFSHHRTSVCGLGGVSQTNQSMGWGYLQSQCIWGLEVQTTFMTAQMMASRDGSCLHTGDTWQDGTNGLKSHCGSHDEQLAKGQKAPRIKCITLYFTATPHVGHSSFLTAPGGKIYSRSPKKVQQDWAKTDKVVYLAPK